MKAACPICDSEDARFKHTLFNDATLRWEDNVVVYQCKSCGLTFSVLAENKEESYGDGYYIYNEQRKKTDRAFAEQCGAWLARHLSLKGRRLLDVGCSRGCFCETANSLGACVTGLDPSPGAVEELRSNHAIQVCTGFYEDFPVTPQFDIITMWDVLEHFENPVKMMNKAFSMLIGNGALVMSVPNHASIFAAVAGPHWKGFNQYHVSHFTIKKLSGLLRESGFKIIKLETFDNVVLSKEGLFRLGVIDRMKSMLSKNDMLKASLLRRRSAMAPFSDVITGHNDYIKDKRQNLLSQVSEIIIKNMLLGDQIRIVAAKT